MTDRELLERAARAANLSLVWSTEPDLCPRRADTFDAWNPLHDDGDALRLAATLYLVVDIGAAVTRARCFSPDVTHECRHHGGSARFAATRRAIVETAAGLAS